MPRNPPLLTFIDENLIFHVEKFFGVMLISIFTALIAGSIQDVLAEDITDILKPVTIKNSEYQFHLQAVLRDADGGLISVTEATNGYYIPHDITDESFDTCFGPNICKKEIVVIDNKKYEKVQYTQKYSLENRSALMFIIVAKFTVTDGYEIKNGNAPIFQAFVPLVYLEEDNVIYAQWTIFRDLK